MGWLDFDLKFDGVSFLDSGVLTIDKIPDITVNSGFGWDTFSAAVTASIITGLISFYAIWASNNTIKAERESQERMALKQLKAQYISSNRQQWINDLRDTVSTYSSHVIAHVNNHIRIFNAVNDNFERKVDAALIDEKRKIQSDTSYCVTKIELLLNPKEPETTEIIGHLNDLATYFNSLKNDTKIDTAVPNNAIVKITTVTKKICKNEWEKIKKHS
ncbi:hypothetical protein ACEZEZ_02290 [Kluyvera ascorbata]|uniref:hypothetical protein n=1 Tax=Kluyvera ascorbata TaxID=51288 RepID=UPI0035CD0694